jgi:hypothetical protein
LAVAQLTGFYLPTRCTDSNKKLSLAETPDHYNLLSATVAESLKQYSTYKYFYAKQHIHCFTLGRPVLFQVCDQELERSNKKINNLTLLNVFFVFENLNVHFKKILNNNFEATRKSSD